MKQSVKKSTKEIADRIKEKSFENIVVLDVSHMNERDKIFTLTLPELDLYGRMLTGGKILLDKLPEDFVSKLSGLGLIKKDDSDLGWRGLKTLSRRYENEIEPADRELVQHVLKEKTEEKSKESQKLEKFGKDLYIEKRGLARYNRLFVPSKIDKINAMIRQRLLDSGETKVGVNVI